jgi:hypothetical protein
VDALYIRGSSSSYNLVLPEACNRRHLEMCLSKARVQLSNSRHFLPSFRLWTVTKWKLETVGENHCMGASPKQIRWLRHSHRP